MLVIDEVGDKLLFPCDSQETAETVLALYTARAWDKAFPDEDIPSRSEAVERLFDDEHDYYYWIREVDFLNGENCVDLAVMEECFAQETFA